MTLPSRNLYACACVFHFFTSNTNNMHSSVFTQGITGLLPLLVRYPDHSLKARQDVPRPSDDITALFPRDNSSAVLEGAGLNDLPEINGTLSRWDDGLVPRSCADILQFSEARLVGGNCSVDNLVVYNLTYADCSDPWVLCQCPEAANVLDASVANFGRLPVATRENVRSLILSPEHSFTGEGQVLGAAFPPQGDLVMYGNRSNITVFLHEAAHILDYTLTSRVDTVYSEQERWRDIVEDGTCVPDNYSTTSYTEAYAQTAVLVAYELNIGSLDDLVNYTCMSDAMDTVTEQLGDLLTYQEDATCSPVEERFAPIDIWCVRDGEAGPCSENQGDGEGSQGDDEDNNEDGESNNEDNESNNQDGEQGNQDDGQDGGQDGQDDGQGDGGSQGNEDGSESRASRSMFGTGLTVVVMAAMIHVSGPV
ncbi:hypothetical protein B0I35DRAFT_153388 [Stachybotrys elegans]|uniref:Uncharacterized protein n=1 Tax=Stachybotrys elegans TaxID=80388 RepID=A0A8K0WJM9_9HYPO|nr:hypothetical protein B0I35DRAFT_153388 [Stachybotrys elegans]